MYKTSSRFVQSNQMLRSEICLCDAAYAVFSFKWQRNNQGKDRVFRYMKLFPKKAKKRANDFFIKQKSREFFGYVMLLYADDHGEIKVISESGDDNLLAEWTRTVCRAKDPLAAGNNGLKESWIDKSAG